jgi:hypothetical protein
MHAMMIISSMRRVSTPTIGSRRSGTMNVLVWTAAMSRRSWVVLQIVARRRHTYDKGKPDNYDKLSMQTISDSSVQGEKGMA